MRERYSGCRKSRFVFLVLGIGCVPPSIGAPQEAGSAEIQIGFIKQMIQELRSRKTLERERELRLQKIEGDLGNLRRLYEAGEISSDEYDKKVQEKKENVRGEDYPITTFDVRFDVDVSDNSPGDVEVTPYTKIKLTREGVTISNEFTSRFEATGEFADEEVLDRKSRGRVAVGLYRGSRGQVYDPLEPPRGFSVGAEGWYSDGRTTRSTGDQQTRSETIDVEAYGFDVIGVWSHYLGGMLDPIPYETDVILSGKIRQSWSDDEINETTSLIGEFGYRYLSNVANSSATFQLVLPRLTVGVVERAESSFDRESFVSLEGRLRWRWPVRWFGATKNVFVSLEVNGGVDKFFNYLGGEEDFRRAFFRPAIFLSYDPRAASGSGMGSGAFGDWYWP